MKAVNLITLSLIAAGLTAPVLAQQTEADKDDFYLGARLGVFSADEDRVAVDNNQLFFVDDGFKTFTSGIEAGYMMTEAWEARIYYDYMEADLVGGGDAYGDSYGVDALYHFNNNIYAGLGVNNTEIGDVTDVAARATVGHRSFINDNLAWRIEGGVQRGWEEDYTEMFANIGLQWFFGGRDASPEPRPRPEPQKAASTPEPKPEPKPVDSDGDGVIDANDKCANTPKDYSVDKDGCIQYENETITEELLVEFDLNSSKIRDNAFDDIEEMAEFMEEHPQLDITIHGHTDSTGEADYNQWLSEKRAKSVADALVNRYGIESSRVDSKGHGESQPKVRENSAADRQANRRIEAILKVVNRVPKERK